MKIGIYACDYDPDRDEWGITLPDGRKVYVTPIDLGVLDADGLELLTRVRLATCPEGA